MKVDKPWVFFYCVKYVCVCGVCVLCIIGLLPSNMARSMADVVVAVVEAWTGIGTRYALHTHTRWRRKKKKKKKEKQKWHRNVHTHKLYNRKWCHRRAREREYKIKPIDLRRPMGLIEPCAALRSLAPAQRTPSDIIYMYIYMYGTSNSNTKSRPYSEMSINNKNNIRGKKGQCILTIRYRSGLKSD